MDDLVDACEPLRRRDLFAPTRVATTIANRGNKGRLISTRHAARRVLLASFVILAIVALLVFGL